MKRTVIILVPVWECADIKGSVALKTKLTGVIVVWFIFLCAIALPLKADDIRSQVNIDYIQCGNLFIQAFTECPAKSEDISLGTCTQYLILRNRTHNSMSAIRNNMDGFAWSWGCVRGKRGLHLLIEYGTGGTCQGCEWTEIYSRNGKLMVSDNTRDMTTSLAIKKIKQFKRLYTRLGLPKKYPHDNFTSMGISKIEKNGTGD